MSPQGRPAALLSELKKAAAWLGEKKNAGWKGMQNNWKDVALNSVLSWGVYSWVMPTVDAFWNRLSAVGVADNRASSFLMCLVVGDTWFRSYEKIARADYKGKYAKLKKNLSVAGYVVGAELLWQAAVYVASKHADGLNVREYIGTLNKGTVVSAPYFIAAVPLINALKYGLTGAERYRERTSKRVRGILGCNLKTPRRRLAYALAGFTAMQLIGGLDILYAHKHNQTPPPAITSSAAQPELLPAR